MTVPYYHPRSSFRRKGAFRSMFGYWLAQSFKFVRDPPLSRLSLEGTMRSQGDCGDAREAARSVMGRVENYHLWFDEDGEPKLGNFNKCYCLQRRGWTRLRFNDLLEKILCYRLQDRIKISEVASHLWFALR